MQEISLNSGYIIQIILDKDKLIGSRYIIAILDTWMHRIKRKSACIIAHYYITVWLILKISNIF